MLAKNLNLKIQTLQLEIDVEKIQMASSVILQFIVYLTNEKFILQLTLKRSIWGQARGLRRKLEDSLKQSKIKRNVFFYNFFHAYIAMFKKVFSTKMLQVQWPELSMRGCKQKKTSEMSCNLGNSLKTFGIGNSKQLTRNSSAKLRNCSVRCRKQQRIPKIQKCLNKPAKKEKIQNAETIQLRPTDPPSRSAQIFTSIFCHRVFCCSRSSISTSNVNVTS